MSTNHNYNTRLMSGALKVKIIYFDDNNDDDTIDSESDNE